MVLLCKDIYRTYDIFKSIDISALSEVDRIVYLFNQATWKALGTWRFDKRSIEICLDSIASKRVRCPDSVIVTDKQQAQRSLCLLFLFLSSRISFLLICKAGKIVHACIQYNCNTLALFEGKIPLARFDLGIIALINACKHLHFNLCISAFFTQVS